MWLAGDMWGTRGRVGCWRVCEFGLRSRAFAGRRPRRSVRLGPRSVAATSRSARDRGWREGTWGGTWPVMRQCRGAVRAQGGAVGHSGPARCGRGSEGLRGLGGSGGGWLAIGARAGRGGVGFQEKAKLHVLHALVYACDDFFLWGWTSGPLFVGGPQVRMARGRCDGVARRWRALGCMVRFGAGGAGRGRRRRRAGWPLRMRRVVVFSRLKKRYFWRNASPTQLSSEELAADRLRLFSGSL